MIIISDKNGQASPFRVGLPHYVGFIGVGFYKLQFCVGVWCLGWCPREGVSSLLRWAGGAIPHCLPPPQERNH